MSHDSLATTDHRPTVTPVTPGPTDPSATSSMPAVSTLSTVSAALRPTLSTSPGVSVASLVVEPDAPVILTQSPRTAAERLQDADELHAGLPEGAAAASSRGPEQREFTRWQRRFTRATFAGDITSAALSIVVGAALTVNFIGARWSTLAVVAAVSFPPVWAALLLVTRCYELRFLLSSSEAIHKLLEAWLRLVAVTAVFACVAPSKAARLFVLVVLPLSLLGGVAVRVAGHEVLRSRRRTGRALHKVVVVGTALSVADMVAQISRDGRNGFSVIGALVDDSTASSIAGVPTVGTPADARRAVTDSRADTVILTTWTEDAHTALTQMCWDLEGLGVDVYVTAGLSGVVGPRLSVRPVADLALLHVDEPELSGPRRVVKSAFDRSVALLALLVFSPLLLALAIAVRLDSSGPAVFRQTRVGRGGRTFTMFKFRSMVVDAEARLAEVQHLNAHDGSHVLFKAKQDPRVTRVGGLLRRLSLDELPQLLNVVLGDMSLVGPRPPLPREVERYADTTTRRLLVRPGVTGLWQVSGRADLSWEESLRLDLHYVENWSLFLDLHILAKTCGAVVRSRGAY